MLDDDFDDQTNHLDRHQAVSRVTKFLSHRADYTRHPPPSLSSHPQTHPLTGITRTGETVSCNVATVQQCNQPTQAQFYFKTNKTKSMMHWLHCSAINTARVGAGVGLSDDATWEKSVGDQLLPSSARKSSSHHCNPSLVPETWETFLCLVYLLWFCCTQWQSGSGSDK